MEDFLLELLKMVGVIVGAGGLVSVLAWWSGYRLKKEGARDKQRRDDRTYIHDGYRELFEKANLRAERLENRVVEMELKIEEGREKFFEAARENMNLRAEITQLRLSMEDDANVRDEN